MNADTIAKILLDNIDDINYGNLLKISNYFKLKEADKSGVTLSEFLDAVITECKSRCHQCDDNKYFAEIILLAWKTKRELRKHPNRNEAHALDCFLLKLRNMSL